MGRAPDWVSEDVGFIPSSASDYWATVPRAVPSIGRIGVAAPNPALLGGPMTGAPTIVGFMGAWHDGSSRGCLSPLGFSVAAGSKVPQTLHTPVPTTCGKARGSML